MTKVTTTQNWLIAGTAFVGSFLAYLLITIGCRLTGLLAPLGNRGAQILDVQQALIWAAVATPVFILTATKPARTIFVVITTFSLVSLLFFALLIYLLNGSIGTSSLGPLAALTLLGPLATFLSVGLKRMLGRSVD